MKIFAKVKAGAKEQKIEKLSENEFVLWVKAPAREGRANAAVLELLSAYFKIPKAGIAIIKGHKSKNKIINILGGDNMKIKIEQLSKDDIQKKGIFSWPIWEKEVSRFGWHYDSVEECYLLGGKVVVETDDGEKVEFGKGDFVTFPKGLSCTWEIKEPVKKHYNFR